MKDKIKQAEMLCRELKLPYMSKNIEVEYEEVLTTNIGLIDMLLSMLTREYDLRLENGKQNRIRRANFPYKKYMEDLKEEFLPEDARKKLWNIKNRKSSKFNISWKSWYRKNSFSNSYRYFSL